MYENAKWDKSKQSICIVHWVTLSESQSPWRVTHLHLSGCLNSAEPVGHSSFSLCAPAGPDPRAQHRQVLLKKSWSQTTTSLPSVNTVPKNLRSPFSPPVQYVEPTPTALDRTPSPAPNDSFSANAHMSCKVNLWSRWSRQRGRCLTNVCVRRAAIYITGANICEGPLGVFSTCVTHVSLVVVVFSRAKQTDGRFVLVWKCIVTRQKCMDKRKGFKE